MTCSPLGPVLTYQRDSPGLTLLIRFIVRVPSDGSCLCFCVRMQEEGVKITSTGFDVVLDASQNHCISLDLAGVQLTDSSVTPEKFTSVFFPLVKTAASMMDVALCVNLWLAGLLMITCACEIRQEWSSSVCACV